MLALVHFGHDHRRIDMPFEDFLFSGFLSPHARAAMCDPEDLVRDHLPAFDPEDEEETCEAFREACEQATDGEANNIRLDRNDLRFVRNAILSPEPNIIPFPRPLESVGGEWGAAPDPAGETRLAGPHMQVPRHGLPLRGNHVPRNGGRCWRTDAGIRKPAWPACRAEPVMDGMDEMDIHGRWTTWTVRGICP